MSGKTGCVGIIFAAFIGGVVILLFFTALGSMERVAAPFFPTATAIVVQAQPAQNDTHAIDAVVDVSKYALDKQAQVAMAGDVAIVAVNAADEGASALSSLAFIVIGVLGILFLVKSFQGGGNGGQ